jgi:mono/diheme cytochrome c family protein
MGAMEMKTRNKLALGGALLIFGYFVVSSAIFSPESSPYTRGRTAAVELGCLACHASGAAPSLTVNPDEPSEKIPPLIGCELTRKDFTTWVLKGRSDTAASGPLPVEGGDVGAAVMPAYEDELDEDDVEDIRAWTRIAGHEPPGAPRASDTRILKGERLASAHGCFHCHGPLGQGGVKNPGSLTGQIPSLTGEEFKHLCDESDPLAVEEWIRRGRSERFLDGSPLRPIGRWFMDRQLTKMPAYDLVLTDEEVDLLVEYCLHLGQLGPLSSGAYSDHLKAITPVRSAPPAITSAVPEGSPSLPAIIAELLSQHCIRCHGPKKDKSDYRMDTKAGAYAPGEIADFLNVSNIAPGAPNSSLLVTFIKAEEEDPENEIFPMPPDEDERLTPEQISLISDWVAAGAPWHESQILHSTYTD